MKAFKITLIVLLALSLVGQIQMAADTGSRGPTTEMILFILACIAALIYSLMKKNKSDEDNGEKIWLK